MIGCEGVAGAELSTAAKFRISGVMDSSDRSLEANEPVDMRLQMLCARQQQHSVPLLYSNLNSRLSFLFVCFSKHYSDSYRSLGVRGAGSEGPSCGDRKRTDGVLGTCEAGRKDKDRSESWVRVVDGARVWWRRERDRAVPFGTSSG